MTRRFLSFFLLGVPVLLFLTGAAWAVGDTQIVLTPIPVSATTTRNTVLPTPTKTSQPVSPQTAWEIAVQKIEAAKERGELSVDEAAFLRFMAPSWRRQISKISLHFSSVSV